MNTNTVSSVGRLVAGHPLQAHASTDDKGQPKMRADGTPNFEIYFAVAFPKQGTTHFSQIPEGRAIFEAGQRDHPQAHQYGEFSWKVDDGDDTRKKKGGKPSPSEREGWPGNWVVHFKAPARQGEILQAHHRGNWTTTIQNPNEIKLGDYVRVIFDAKGNGTQAQTPGVYVNPKVVELVAAGERIVGAGGVDAAAAFGAAGEAQLPPGAVVDTAATVPAAPAMPAAPATPPPAPGAPAHPTQPDASFIAPPPPPAAAEPMLMYNGVSKTHAEWLASGWTAEQITAYCTPA